MDFQLLIRTFSKPWVSNKTAQDILVYIHFSSPIILLAFFLIAFTAHSIVTASKDDVVQPDANQTGPGGKPLPQKTRGKPIAKPLDFSRARKLAFDWLSAGAVATFLGNAVVVILHAVIKRKDNWWCGESVAVGGDLAETEMLISCANCDHLDLRCCLLLCLYPLPYFITGHQTLTHSSTLFHLACSSDIGAYHPRSFPSHL